MTEELKVIKVIKVITYSCPICGYTYGNRKTRPEDAKRWAEECLAKGLAPTYPPGCIYGDHRPGAFYENITLAVACNNVHKRYTFSAHMNLGSSWACRNNGMGDSLYAETCGGNSLSLGKEDYHLDPTQSHFQRMVKYLQENCIPITVWDGEKPVPYEEFMKKWEKNEWPTKS